MANNLKSMINVIANDEAVAMLEKKLVGIKYGNIASFAQGFYENVKMSDTDGVMNDWSIENLGSKWTYFSDNWGGGEFVIESAWYAPKEFYIHLYKMMVEIDPEVVIEVKYEDESYNPVGAFLIKKDEEGDAMWAQNEDDELEDPTVDMDWDDEEFEEAQLDFMDEVSSAQERMLELCHEQIDDLDGNNVYDVE